MNETDKPRDFHYQGKIYIRPLGRGIILEGCEPENYLSYAIAHAFTGTGIGSGDFQVEIHVHICVVGDDAEAQ